MDEKLIEQVARAIIATTWNDPAYVEEYWKAHVDEARAAIDAMQSYKQSDYKSTRGILEPYIEKELYKGREDETSKTSEAKPDCPMCGGRPCMHSNSSERSVKE